MIATGWLIPALLGGGVLIVVAVLLFLFWKRSQEVNLTETPVGEKPVWMRTQPPVETLAAAQADGLGVRLYDHDEGEMLAAPFAEQIEDIVGARVAEDPTVSQYEVDFGTADDGTLEVWVNGQRYTDVAEIPHPRLREIIRDAVQSWQERP
ncbi:MAG: hypothetical protein ACP5HM_02810 [Anaerolineae bacterium]